MAASGVSIHKVWVGHTNINTTDSIYTHLFNIDNTDDMARVDAWVSEQKRG